MNEASFVAAPNTRASVALIKLAFVIRGSRIDQFSRSFLPAVASVKFAAVGEFSGDTLSSFKSTMNL